MLSSFPFPEATLSEAGFLAGAGLVVAALALAFEEDFAVVTFVALADFFVLGAASDTSSTAALVCFFMFYLD
ncbi:hypothetical protein ACFSRY_19745 [Pontibacter locisalis]|uniref:Uncharacterized protein n=1 Tax=Pontibacter locisalis TaxID=1719035 RepID=A0ABW5IRT6_9BACT